MVLGRVPSSSSVVVFVGCCPPWLDKSASGEVASPRVKSLDNKLVLLVWTDPGDADFSVIEISNNRTAAVVEVSAGEQEKWISVSEIILSTHSL